MLYALAALTSISATLAASQNPVTTDPHAFRVPVLTRGYQNYNYTQAGVESINAYADAIAALQPTYVSGLVYLEVNTTIDDDMVNFYKQVKSRIRSQLSHKVWFDLEVSMNPNAWPHFHGPQNVSDTLAFFDEKFGPVDAWWFDFWSDAYVNANQSVDSRSWVNDAVAYAANNSQCVGGNNFGSVYVVGSDVIGFTDNTNGGLFGYGIDPVKLGELVDDAKSQGNTNFTLLGHLQSNPQNQNRGTFSCDYNLDWDTDKRTQYLTSWAQNQTTYNYTFMYPGFYPMCPVGISFNPTTGSQPLLPAIENLINQYNGVKGQN